MCSRVIWSFLMIYIAGGFDDHVSVSKSHANLKSSGTERKLEQMCCPWEASEHEAVHLPKDCPNFTHPRCTGAAATPVPRFKRPKPVFMVKHITKAGGTYIGFLLREIMKDRNCVVKSDDTELKRPDDYLDHAFLAITYRNPCDMYLSYANFHHWKAYGFGEPRMGQNPMTKRGMLNVSEFGDWVSNARLSDGTGFFSFQFWYDVLQPNCRWFFMKRNNTPVPYMEAFCMNRSRMHEDLRDFKPTRLAHCWILQETLDDDLRECLHLYEQSSEFARGSVNWTRFDQLSTNQTFANEVWLEQSRRLRHNRTRHCSGTLIPGASVSNKLVSSQSKRRKAGTCTDYWKDPRLQELIYKGDWALFGKLGYRECCAPSDHVLV